MLQGKKFVRMVLRIGLIGTLSFSFVHIALRIPPTLERNIAQAPYTTDSLVGYPSSSLFAALRRDFAEVTAWIIPKAYASVSSDSLVGYWKFDEGTGTNAADSSGHGNNGTLTNGPTWTTTKPSLSYTNPYALSFDGTDDYVITTSNMGLSGDFEATISAWVKFNDTNTGYKAIVDFGSTGVREGFALFQGINGAGSITVGFYGAQNCNTSASTITTGQWYHLVGTKVPGAIGVATTKLNINGSQQSISCNTSSVPNMVNGKLYIGSDAASEISNSILVDDVRIYSRALSAAEIAELAAGSHTTTIWTGGTSTNWETASNWSPAAVPDPYANIIIRTATYQPVMTAHNSGSSLTIETSASLDLKNHNFELTDGGSIKGGGTLKLIGGQTMDGVSNTGTGTVLYYGSGSYTGLAAGNTYHNLTIDNGLIGYWKLDDGTGSTIARDSSQYGNNGTLTNMDPATDWAPAGTSGTKFYNPSSLDFDGSNDYILLPDVDQYDLNRGFTITTWINTDTTGAYQPIYALNNNGVTLRLSSAQKLQTEKSLVATILTSTTSVSANTWAHVALTYSEGSTSTVRIYLNGQIDGSTTTTQTFASTNAARIGNESSTYFNGHIDDLRIYSRVLAPSEVAALAAGNLGTGSGVYILGSALDINGNISILAGDISAGSQNITVAGNWKNVATFTHGTSTVTFDGSGNQTLSGSTVFNNLMITTSAARTAFFDYTGRQSASGALTLRGQAGNLLSLRSTRAGSGARLFLDGDSGTQTIDYLNVKDSNATGGQTLECLTSSEGCTNAGNNTNWSFAASYSISGRAYSDEGITPLASKTVGVSINGATMANSTTTNAAGAYTITGLSTSKGDVLTLWIDGHTEKAVTVTISSGSTMTGVSLYKNFLILRNETGGTITNTHLATAITSNSSDTDIAAILSAASAASMTTVGGKTLLIAANTTFAAGGTLSLGGSFKANGTFSPSTSTVTMTATGASTITMNGSSLHNLTIEDPTETGLVGYWKFDEGTGTSTADSSGNGNTGTLTNGPTWTTTKPSLGFSNPYALSFDGVNDYVNVPDSANLRPNNGSWTVSAWAKPNNANQFLVVVGKRQNGGDYESYGLSICANAYTGAAGKKLCGAMRQNESNDRIYHTDNDIADGNWHHLTMTTDASTTSLKLYADGILQSITAAHAVGAWPTVDNTDPLTIASGNGAYYFNSFIDDVRIYARALSASEVAALSRGEYADPDNGTATITLGSALDVNGNLNIVSGILDVSASNYNINLAGNWYAGTGSFVKRSGTVTLDGTTQTLSGGTLFHNLTKTVTSPTTLFVAHNAQLSVSGSLTLRGIASNLLSLRSTRAGSGARLFLDGDAGTQTIDYLNVKDSNATGGQTLECLTSSEGCTNAGNNTNWSFAASYSISGRAYSDEGITALASKTVGVSINGATMANSTTTNAAGAFTISNVSTSKGDVLTLWIDGHTEKAVTVTISSGSTMTGVSLYKNFLILRNETGGTITNTHLATAKTSNSSDTDISAILSQASASSITTVGGKTLLIAANTTFAPGGTLSLGGSFKANGTFIPGTSTVTITATGSSTITTNGSSLYNLTISSPSETGLVGYWKLDEGTGTSTADSSGNGRTGTLTNGPTWTTTKPTLQFSNPYALSFDGTDDYVSIPSTLNSSLNSSTISVSMWANPNSLTTYYALISEAYAGDGVIRFTLTPWNAGKIAAAFYDGGWRIAEATVATSQWSHLTGTYNGSTLKFYVNGSEAASLSYTGSMSGSEGWYIGRRWDLANHFSGYLDDIRIYSTTLSPSEISNLAQGYAANGSSTITLGSALDINGNLSVTSTMLDVSASNYSINLAGNWYAGTGSFVKRSGTVTLDGTTQTLSGTTLFHNLTKTVVTPQTLFISRHARLSVSGSLTLQGTASNLLTIRSTSNGNAGGIFVDSDSGTQNISYLDVKDSNASGGQTLECITATEGCINSGNTTNWSFVPLVSISGRAYSDEGITALASKTVGVSINGAAMISSATTNAAGAFTISGVSTTKGDVLTLWIDGHTEKAVTVTVSSGSTMTGVSLYKNFLILRNETGGTITNTHLATAKTSNSSDTDIAAILSAASAASMTTVGGKTLLIASNTTFAPGETLSLGGSFKANGTFIPSTSTVTITATGASTITMNGSSVHNLTIEDPTETGLVGYWKFDEGTGTSATDSSGNGKTGTLTNGPVYTTTKPNLRFDNPYALTFDGTNDFVLLPATSLYDLQTLSIATWVYATNFNQYGFMFEKTTNGSLNTQYSCFFDASSTMYFRTYNAGASLDDLTMSLATAGITNSQWNHVVCRYDGSTKKMFINGVEKSSKAYAQTLQTNANGTAIIGAYGSGQGYFFNGKMDDVRLYGRSLSASEVAALARGEYADPDNGTATITLGSALDVNGSLNIVSGILDVSASHYGINLAGNWFAGTGSFLKRSGTVTLDGTTQTLSGITLFHNLTKTVTTPQTLFVGRGTVLSVSGALTLRGAASNLLSIRSTAAGTAARLFLDGDSGTQTIDYLNVKDSDATGGAALECYTATEGCVNSGNNTNWTFAVAAFGDISGKVYSDHGTTPLASKTISLSINGAADAASVVTAGNGSYSFTGVSFAQGDVLTIYIEDATEDAVTVTLAGSGAMTNVDLYQNHLITRSENGGALTNANLATADNTGDNDITSIYTMSSQALTMVSGKELFIPTGHTYQPSAAVTTALLDIRGTYVHGSETLTMNGSYTHSTGTFTGGSGIFTLVGSFTLSGGTFTAPSGSMTISASFTQTGSPTFNANSGTITFNSIDTATISTPGITYNRAIITKTGGSNYIDQVFTIASGTTLPLGNNPTSTLSNDHYYGVISMINNGTLTLGTGTWTVNVESSFTNNGVISGNVSTWNHPAAFTNTKTINLPSLTAMDFDYNYTHSAAATLVIAATPTIAIGGSLTLPTGTTFPMDATVTFDTVNGATIDTPGITYANVVINKTGTISADPVFTVSNGTLLPLGDNPTTTLSNYQYYGVISLVNNGTLTIGTGTWTLSVESTFTNNGSIITRSAVRSGTSITNGTNSSIEFIGATDSQTAIQTITGFATSYYHLYIGSADSGDIFSLGSAPTITGNLVISGGTLNLAGYNLSPSGTLTVGTGTTLRLRGSETISNFGKVYQRTTMWYDHTTGTYPMLNKEFWNLVIGSPSTAVYHFPTPYAKTFSGSITLSGGTLAVTNGQQLTVSGSWLQSGTGRFSAGTGKVVLNGGNQTIAGTTVFNNLTKTVLSARTLTFGSTGQTSVSGSLVLNGTGSNLLSLRSSIPGTASRLILDGDSGSQTIMYLNVKDNDASGGLQLECFTATEGCVDAGNTTNWFFGATNNKGFFYFFGF